MNAKKCDRCDKFYELYNEKSYNADPNALMLIQEQENKETYYPKQYDLCPSCMIELQKFILRGAK